MKLVRLVLRVEGQRARACKQQPAEPELGPNTGAGRRQNMEICKMLNSHTAPALSVTQPIFWLRYTG